MTINIVFIILFILIWTLYFFFIAEQKKLKKDLQIEKTRNKTYLLYLYTCEFTNTTPQEDVSYSISSASSIKTLKDIQGVIDLMMH